MEHAPDPADGAPDRGAITRLLTDAGHGNATALAAVTPLVYDELRRLAAVVLRHRSPGQTLRTTGLVHEAYAKLVAQTGVEWEGRSHFFGVAAKAMRSILVDYVRGQQAIKRGGDAERVPLDEAVATLRDQRVDVIDLDAALTRLAERDERKARMVELRFFAGMSIAETAEVLGVSHATVERDWQVARAWLHRDIRNAR